MKDRIAKSVFWIVWSRGGIQVLSFISTILVARMLAPSDYGVMALAGIWMAGVSMLAELGLGAAIIQFRDLEDRDLNSCFWLTMGIAGIGYLGLYIAAPAIADWFSSPILSDVLRVVGVTLPLTALRIVPDGLLRKRLALDKVSQAEIAASLVTLPVMLGMAWAGAGVWALVAGALVQSLVQDVVIIRFVSWWPGLRIGGRRFREVVSYSMHTLGARMCWVAYQQADSFVLGKVSGDVVLGFYSMAKQLATLPVDKVSVVVNQIMAPMMAELQTKREMMRASFLRSLRLIATISLPLCIGLMMEADDLILVALSQKWMSAVPIMRVLCLYAIVYSIAVLFSPVLMACYRARFLFRYTLLQLLVMPFAFWMGATLWGAVGVAIAWSTAYPLALTWLAREALREMDLNWHSFFHQFRPAVIATAVMALTLALVQWAWMRWGVDLAPLRLAVAVLLGAALYSGVLLWIGGPIRNEVKEVVGWMFHGGRVVIAAK
jgi:O-antigen/teichoic acid export membrane protein